MRALKFTSCGCAEPVLTRLRRPAWMRWLFPRRRLYVCHVCGQSVLIEKQRLP